MTELPKAAIVRIAKAAGAERVGAAGTDTDSNGFSYGSHDTPGTKRGIPVWLTIGL